MPGPKPAPVVLSEKQRDSLLNRAVRREKSTQQQSALQRRACLLPMMRQLPIARRLNLTLQTVPSVAPKLATSSKPRHAHCGRTR